MNIWEILQVSGKRKRQRKGGVIPMLCTGCSIALQHTGPAQLHGHAAKKGHAEGVLDKYASLWGKRLPWSRLHLTRPAGPARLPLLPIGGAGVLTRHHSQPPA